MNDADDIRAVAALTFRPMGRAAARALNSGDRIASRDGAICEVVQNDVTPDSPAEARITVRPLLQVQGRHHEREFSISVANMARWSSFQGGKAQA